MAKAKAKAKAAEQSEPTQDSQALLFIRRGEVVFGEINKRAKELMVHNYGNYVIQTVITQMAPRAIPHTFIEQTLHTVIETIIDNIFEASVQKFASNCVQRAITATAVIHDG